MEVIILGVFAVAGVVALMIVASMLRGWALSTLWAWFAVPIFGLPPLGIAQAIGISLTLGMITHQYVPTKEKDTAGPILFSLLMPLLAVGIGWIVRRWL
jgi:hypothetical protein